MVWVLALTTVGLLASNIVYYAVHIREDFARNMPERGIIGLVTVIGLNLALGFIAYQAAMEDLVL